MRIAVLWTAGIIMLSFLPGKAKVTIGTETQSHTPAAQRRAILFHRTGHLIGFGVASLLFVAASSGNIRRFQYWLMISAMGSTIEWLQHVIYGSVFEWWDIRDDVDAAAAGYLLGLLLNYLFSKIN